MSIQLARLFLLGLLALPLAAPAQSVGQGEAARETVGPAGLWAGTVTIDRVAHVLARHPGQPEPAAGTYEFPIFLHVDEEGLVRLVPTVVLLADEAGAVRAYVGHGAIAEAVAGARPEALRNGVRYSSANFTSPDPVLPVSGAFSGGSVLEVLVEILPSDPASPFIHAAHPDHSPAAKAELRITRRLTLFPSFVEPERNIAGGDFSETITGLHAVPIDVAGSFELRRVWDGTALQGSTR